MAESPRVLTKEEAAAYCGCKTLAAFDQWRKKGIVPDAIPGTNRWDRKAIDQALDRASGLATDEQKELSPYRQWRAVEVAAGRLPERRD